MSDVDKGVNGPVDDSWHRFKLVFSETASLGFGIAVAPLFAKPESRRNRARVLMGHLLMGYLPSSDDITVFCTTR